MKCSICKGSLDFSKRFKKLKESDLTYPEMLGMFKDLKSGSIYNFVCNNYTTKVNLRQEEFDATDIFNSDKVQNTCIKASQLILIKTKHTTNEKIQIYIRMLPYYILKFRDILSTKQFEDLCTKRIKLLCDSDNFYQFYYLLTEIDPVAFDENFEQKITDIVEDYIFIHPSKIYNDFRYSCCENGNFSDETISKNIRHIIEIFLDNNEDAIVEKVKKVVKVAFDTFSNIVDEFEKVGRAKEDAAIAQYQKYIDWIENGNPVYYIHGWSYKGAKLKRISINEALKQLEKEKPFEYNWENINGEKALVLQYVGENDLY